MRVFATAGHVDHGKSTLVRALTGMEPDRWAEERRRGMTIDLGFAWTTLDDDRTVAFVDVPGHERFVTQMLAGVGPVPATMFVVAADSGWMPQSGEHLDALHALGVTDGLLVVTRSDLTDPELARDEALEHLAESSFGRPAAVCVSGTTGEGLDELRAALGDLAARLPEPDLDADVRLWVDRAFTVRGAGTVVTGTLGAGTVAVGDELTLGERRVTVRGMQELGEPVDAARAVARVALNLRGTSLEEVGRGDALTTPGRWLTSDVVDVRVAPPRGGTEAVELPKQVMVHVGSAAVAARVRPLSRAEAPDLLGGPAELTGPSDPPDPSGLVLGATPTRTVRLTLHTALPLRPGDRALLRDPGAHRILGGVTVLDVRPPSLRRRGAAAARAGELATTDGTPDGAGELRRRRTMRRDELTALGATVPPGTPEAGGWLVDPVHLAALAERLVAAVTEHARTDPLDPGLPARAAVRAIDLPDARLLDVVLAAPGAAAELSSADGRVAPRVGAGLPEKVRTALETVRADLADDPFAAPEANRLTELGLRSKELGAAVRSGGLLKVGDGIYLRPEAPEVAVEKLATLPSPFTLSEARQALGTTRRVAVPLLEYLAKHGRTRRDDEGRHALR